MAKLSANGREIVRCLSVTRRALVSYRIGGKIAYATGQGPSAEGTPLDGKILTRTPWGPWRLAARFDSRVLTEERIRAGYDKMAEWKKQSSIPSRDQINRWLFDDAVCETPSGDMVEPDGIGPDGAPSWAKFFGMI